MIKGIAGAIEMRDAVSVQEAMLIERETRPMRYIGTESFDRLVAWGRITRVHPRSVYGILKITLPEPGGAVQYEDCMSVRNPPEVGKPIPLDYVPEPSW